MYPDIKSNPDENTTILAYKAKIEKLYSKVKEFSNILAEGTMLDTHDQDFWRRDSDSLSTHTVPEDERMLYP